MNFRYRLTGAGWAEADIAEGASAATIRASYLNDALRLLLDAIDRLLQGAAEARCSWADEPGEYRWIIERDGNQAHLRVLAFHDIESPEPDHSGAVLFDTTRPAREIAAAIADGAQTTLDEYGAGGYLSGWASPFPLAELRAIQARLSGSHETRR